jgi:transcriptional regulator of arginine metabolism
MNKTLRQRAELEIIREGTLPSQEALQKALRRLGFKVGQATLSRDIRDLNLIKTTHGYALAKSVEPTHSGLPPMSQIVREFVLQVRLAQNLLVLKTVAGSAQPVAAAMDQQDWTELIGTVAGDDTVLIVCPDKAAAKKLADRIEEMIG